MNRETKAVPFVRISAASIAAVLLWLACSVADGLHRFIGNSEMIGHLLLAAVMLVGIAAAATVFSVLCLTGQTPSWMNRTKHGDSNTILEPSSKG